jgi:hypothetical protein
MRLVSALPASYFDDPFASTLHKAASRNYRRHAYPKGLAAPSWYRDAALTASERSTISE